MANSITLCCSYLLLLATATHSFARPTMDTETTRKTFLLPAVAEYVQQREKEFEKIPKEQKETLENLATRIADQLKKHKKADLVFICTHNSRRSQLCQVWADVAATTFRIDRVNSYSGGTEETAFNPRAVKTLREAGLKIAELKLRFQVGDTADVTNPRYEVIHQKKGEPLVCSSKVFDKAPNPKKGFIAVMTCSEADRSCPKVDGASARIPLPYIDPKVSDGTAEEAATYADRCAQISREMLFLFSKVASEKQ